MVFTPRSVCAAPYYASLPEVTHRETIKLFDTLRNRVVSIIFITKSKEILLQLISFHDPRRVYDLLEYQGNSKNDEEGLYFRS